MWPSLQIDLEKIQHNTKMINARVQESGGYLVGVTKVTGGDPFVAKAMIAGGVHALGESRMANIHRLRLSGITTPILLMRSPILREVEQVVAEVDISLNSEQKVLHALARAALQQETTHEVILMTDLGDGREGVSPDLLPQLVSYARGLEGLVVRGIGVNLACFSGVIPKIVHMQQLQALAAQCDLRDNAYLSGGNSSALPLLFSTEPSALARINHWRIGESILFGWDILTQAALPSCQQHVCQLTAEIIEVQTKLSPSGRMEKRAIVALGTQEIGTGQVYPLNPGLAVVGASSDHLILRVRHETTITVGNRVEFTLDYSSLMAVATCPYVRIEYRTEVD